MPRLLALPLVIVAWFLGFAFLGLAWAQPGDPASALALPAAGGSFVLNLSDLTFPGAVFLGFWLLARALPGTLRSWTPTLRVELVHRDRDPGEPGH